MGKIIVGKAANIPAGKMQKVTTDGKEILIVNVDGNFYAMDDTCTHAGASLSEGTLEGSILTVAGMEQSLIVKRATFMHFQQK